MLYEKKSFYEKCFIGIIISAFFVWFCMILADGSLSKQFQIFFRECQDFFADMTNVVGYSGKLNPYYNTVYSGLGEKAYPPLIYAVLYGFSRLVNIDSYYERNYFLWMYQEPKFLIMFLICAGITVVMLYEVLRSCKNGSNGVKIFTAFAFLFSAPMIYSYERGNTIILTTFCVMFFLYYYNHEKKYMREIALVMLALATALKMTPCILGIVLIYHRKWKEILHLLIYAVILGLGPFLFMEGGFHNISKMISNMSLNVANYSSEDGCTLQAAAMSCVNQLNTRFGMQIVPGTGLRVVTTILTYSSSIAMLLFAGFMKKRWHQIMAVCLVLVILPSHSGYYCLLYLIPGFLAFLNEEVHEKKDLWVLAALLIVSFPIQSELVKSFLNFHVTIVILTVFLTICACKVGIPAIRSGEFRKSLAFRVSK